MEKRAVYVIVSIAVVLVLGFSLYQFTGYSVKGKCIDSDDLNFNVRGTTTYENRDAVYEDRCFTRHWLKEYYCPTDIRISAMKHQCENECKDGACI